MALPVEPTAAADLTDLMYGELSYAFKHQMVMSGCKFVWYTVGMRGRIPYQAWDDADCMYLMGGPL